MSRTNPIVERVYDYLSEMQRGSLDLTWMSAVGIQGAHAMLDDIAQTFAVNPARP